VRMVLTVQVRSWNVAAAEQAKESLPTLMVIQNPPPPTFAQVRVPDPGAQGIQVQWAMVCVRAMSVFWVLVLMDPDLLQSLATKIQIVPAMSAFQVAALNQQVQGRVVTPTVTVNWGYVRMVLTVQVHGRNVVAVEKASQSGVTRLMTFQNPPPPTFAQVRVPDPDAQGMQGRGAMIYVRAMSVF